MASWIDANGNAQNIIECKCSKEKNCHPSIESSVCNCDAVPTVNAWLEDTVSIKDRKKLPIKGFKYGFLRGKANLTIGKLFCKGAEPVFNLALKSR